MNRITTNPKFQKNDLVGLMNDADSNHYKVVESRYNNPLYQDKWSYKCYKVGESKANIHIFEEKRLGLVEKDSRNDSIVGTANSVFLFNPVASDKVQLNTSPMPLPFEIEKTVEYPDHQLHLDLILKMHETYKIKNIDYGSSFSEQYEEHGILSAIIRFDDKIRRIKQLMRRGKAEVNDESLKDSVQDLANYAVMLWMELEKEEKNRSL